MPPIRIKVQCEECLEWREIQKPAVMPKLCRPCHNAEQKRLLGVIVRPREFGFVPYKNYKRE